MNDALIGALKHRNRREILTHIVEKGEPVSPKQASEELEEPLSNLSYHVRVLKSAGALILVDQQPIRGSIQNFYIPNPQVTGAAWVREVLELPSEDDEA